MKFHFKYFKSHWVIITCVVLILISDINIRNEIKSLSKFLSIKIDTLEDSMVALNSDVDDSLLPEMSQDELYNEFGISRGDNINPHHFNESFTSHPEKQVIASIAKASHNMLEIGTGKGGTTLIMAKCSHPEATIHTIDLPNNSKVISFEHGDSPALAASAVKSRTSENYVYNKTKYKKKIHQIFADTKNFDEKQLSQQLDFILIDGAKTYSYMKNDTQKAFNMIKAKGIILWHSYDRKCPDVIRFINELSQKHRIYRVKGTSFVAYKAV